MSRAAAMSTRLLLSVLLVSTCALIGAASDGSRLVHSRTVLENEILANPLEAPLYHQLGVLLFEQGELDDALRVLSSAAKLDGADAVTQFHLGVVQSQRGKRKRALLHFTRAAELQPDFVEAWFNAGQLWMQRENADAAEQCFRRVVALKPTHGKAYNHLAVLYINQDKEDEALRALRQATDADPTHAGVWYNLAKLEERRGEVTDAIAHLRRAVDIDAELVDAQVSLGALLAATGHYADSLLPFLNAIELAPENEVAIVLAMDVCKRSADIHTQYALADLFGDMLTSVLEDEALVPILSPVSAMTHVLPKDVEELIMERHAAWAELQARQSLADYPKLPRRPDWVTHRLAVGYVGSDWTAGSPLVSRLEGLLASHDRHSVEVYVLDAGGDASGIAHLLHDDFIVDVSANSPAATAAHARMLGVHALVSVDGYAGAVENNAMLALETAALQMYWPGLPVSMQLDAVSHMLTDAVATPPELDGDVAEALVYLPHTATLNTHHMHAAFASSHWRDTAPVRMALGIAPGAFVFGHSGDVAALDASVLDEWASILTQAAPSTVLAVVCTHPEQESNLRLALEERSVDGKRLVALRGGADAAENLSQLGVVDLWLDTFAQSDHRAASDALWRGVPVLTLAGARQRQRGAASLLASCAAPCAADLIVDSVDAYVAQALRLAKDERRMYTRARECVRTNVAYCPSFSTATFARAHEAALHMTWELRMVGGDTARHHIITATPH